MVWCFFLFFQSLGQIFGVFFAPFPEEEISDYLAQGSFIRVLTVGDVIHYLPSERNSWDNESTYMGETNSIWGVHVERLRLCICGGPSRGITYYLIIRADFRMDDRLMVHLPRCEKRRRGVGT
jgi:hypothetical protein